MICPKCNTEMTLVTLKRSEELYYTCGHCGYTPLSRRPPIEEPADDLEGETVAPSSGTPAMTNERVVPPSRLPTRRALGRWIAIFAIAILLAIWIQSEKTPKVSAPEQTAETLEKEIPIPLAPPSPEEPTPVPAVAPTPPPSPKRTEVATAPKPEAPAPRTGRQRSTYVPPDDWGAPKPVGSGSAIDPASEASLMTKLLDTWDIIPERGANAGWKFGRRGSRICLWKSRDDVICLEPRGNAFVEVYVGDTGYSRTEALAIAKRTLLD